MIRSIIGAWKVPDLRNRMIYTLLLLIVFRLGASIPVPGMDRGELDKLFEGGSAGLFDMFNLFSGGAFSNFTIFALSITPYITATIIMQLLTIAIPKLEVIARSGEEGRKKIAQISRYLTVVLAIIQAIGLSVGLFRQALISTDFFAVALVVLTLAAGTAFLMWLGEQITENGIGNGISLIIFAGILSRLPSAFISGFKRLQAGELSYVTVGFFVFFALVVIVGVILVQQGSRRIPVQYAKRVVGRKMYGGQSTHIPIKVNQAGVIPVIFAMALMQFPLTLTLFIKGGAFADFVAKYLSPTGSPGAVIYSTLNFFLIIGFTFFYTAVTFNPGEVSSNMRNNGGFIPGIRPGKPTTEYLTKVMTRITIVGALFLAIIATLPVVVSTYTALKIGFGGTSLLIVVGVALETVKQIESQMQMRNYQGFLK